METKVCTKCRIDKPVSEYSNNPQTTYHNCKECRYKKQRKYRETHKEFIKAGQKRYREENKEKLSKKNKEKYKNNKEECSAKSKINYINNKEKIKLRVNKYRKDNVEILKAKAKKYRQSEAYKEYHGKYMKEYYSNNKERYRTYRTYRKPVSRINRVVGYKNEQEARDKLADRYVRKIISQNNSIDSKYITNSQIEAKREELITKRKERENTPGHYKFDRNKYMERYREKRREYNRKYKSELSEGYIRGLISDQMGIRGEYITQELIELKRLVLIGKRELRQVKG